MMHPMNRLGKGEKNQKLYLYNLRFFQKVFTAKAYIHIEMKFNRCETLKSTLKMNAKYILFEML